MNTKNSDYQAVLAKVQEKMKYKNIFEVPHFIKIIVNMGLNDAVNSKGIIEKAASQLVIIAGQKPMVTLAKKSISAFKLRRGMPVGVKATLRGQRMLDFWEKLVKIVLPRQRDFKGISAKGFDGSGNLNIGFREQTIFPELEYDKIDKPRGVEVTIVTSAATDKEARVLLEEFGMPFRKDITTK